MAKNKQSGLLTKKRAKKQFDQKKFAMAANSYAAICNKRPNDEDAWVMYGLCKQYLGELDNAINIFKHAATINPDSALIHNKKGEAYFRKNQIDMAIEDFRMAVQLNNKQPEAHDNLTKSLLLVGYFHETIKACNEAIKIYPDNAEFHCRLGAALEKTNQIDESKKAIINALQIEPQHIRANFISAKIDRREGRNEDARDRLIALLQYNLPPAEAATLSAELGNVLDQLGDYTEAYKQFETSNRYLASMVTKEQAEKETILIHINRLIFWLSEKNTTDWDKQTFSDNVQTPVFLVGFPRSGTTLTEQIISTLDNVLPSDEKPFISHLIRELPELLQRQFNYPADLSTLTKTEIELLRQRYWQLVNTMLGNNNSAKKLLDKLPLNIIDLIFIYRIFPDARIIVVIRDPRDCILSCFMQPFQPNQSMINFLTLKQSAKFYTTVMKLWMRYKTVLNLSYTELRYEDLVNDFETETKKLITFIGENWNEDILEYHKRASSRNVTTPSYSAIASPVYTSAVNRWENYKPQMEALTAELTPYIKEFKYL